MSFEDLLYRLLYSREDQEWVVLVVGVLITALAVVRWVWRGRVGGGKGDE